MKLLESILSFYFCTDVITFVSLAYYQNGVVTMIEKEKRTNKDYIIKILDKTETFRFLKHTRFHGKY